MGNRNTFFRYAPFIYLAQPEGKGPYYLFVAVRKQKNEWIKLLPATDGQMIHYQDGVTSIQLLVSQKDGHSDEKKGDFFLKRYELKPEEHYSSGFDPEQLEIEVSVAVMEEGEAAEQKVFTNTIGYVDADTQPLSEEQLRQAFAHNCPYIYLHPEVLPSESGENLDDSTGLFHPYVLIAPKGCRLAGPKEKVLDTHPNNRIFEYLLILSAGDDTLDDDYFFPFVNPDKLKINQERYPDSQQIKDHFTATVVCLEKEKEAEALGFLEYKEVRQLLQELEQGVAYEWPSREELPNGKIAPGATLHRAKTRNMSSRRKKARAIDTSSIA